MPLCNAIQNNLLNTNPSEYKSIMFPKYALQDKNAFATHLTDRVINGVQYQSFRKFQLNPNEIPNTHSPR